jgi:hypothetical protein
MSQPRPRFRSPWLDERGPRANKGARKDTLEARKRAEQFGYVEPSGAKAERKAERTEEPATPQRTDAPAWTQAVFAVFGIIAVGTLALAATGNPEAFGVAVTVPILFVITLIVARRVAVIDRNPRLVPIIMSGLCLKLMGTLLRYFVSMSVYGTGDFFDYDKYGRLIADSLRHGSLMPLDGRLSGTNFMRYLTGFLYFLSPTRMLSGFAIYSFLSFVGVLFFWRAYRIAVSEKHDVTYLLWLLLFPSMLYWPSAIGKDAFMVLAAGVAAYGAACLFKQRAITGIVALTLGLLGMIQVRPHFALAVVGGLALAVLIRRQRGFVYTIVSLAAVGVLGMVVISSASSFFGFSALSRTSVVNTLNDASAQSSTGGSSFPPVVVSSPIDMPLATLTVLYRPLPLEASSPQEILTGMEGAALLLLTIRAFRRSLRALRYSRDFPYLLYCVGAILMFIIAFSGFSNFGLLARQRGVIQPLFLVFLSLPKNVDALFGGVARPVSRRKQERAERDAWRASL